MRWRNIWLLSIPFQKYIQIRLIHCLNQLPLKSISSINHSFPLGGYYITLNCFNQLTWFYNCLGCFECLSSPLPLHMNDKWKPITFNRYDHLERLITPRIPLRPFGVIPPVIASTIQFSISKQFVRWPSSVSVCYHIYTK